MTRALSVFAGPSLAARRISGVRWRGPAVAGDLLALGDGEPHRVLLIDGLFDGERAPWHKEILVLLAQGFDIWGAASMGALRAVELAKFGMRPLGGIARAYQDGRITGDDEVAVAHGPAQFGHRPLSVAQVDVRATLLGAMKAGVMTRAEARHVRAASRAIYFKRRTWEAVADTARAILGPASPAPAWLLANRAAFKDIDAAAALDAALHTETSISRCPPPPETVFLRRLRDQVSRQAYRRPST